MPAYARLPDSIYYADGIITDWLDNIKDFIKNYDDKDWFCSSWVNHDETWYDNEYTGNDTRLAEHHKKYNTAKNALYIYNYEIVDTLPDCYNEYKIEDPNVSYLIVNVKWRISGDGRAWNFGYEINNLFEQIDAHDFEGTEHSGWVDVFDKATPDRGTIKFITPINI